MVEVMKLMVTSLKMSHSHTATLNACNPEAGHQQPMPPPEIPGHSCKCLGQFLVVSLLFSPGSWCAQVVVVVVPSKSLFPQSYESSGGSMVGLMATSSKRAYAIPRSTAPRAPASAAVHY